MYKARKGAALIIALIVVLVGSAVIAAVYYLTHDYSRLSQRHMLGYVDHTALASYIQAVKGRIVAQNEANWVTLHVPAVWNPVTEQTGPADGAPRLTMENLRFAAADFEGTGNFPDNIVLNLRNVIPAVATRDGSMANVVQIEVFDVFFRFDWIDPAEFARAAPNDFPSAFILPEVGGGGGGGGGWFERGGTTQAGASIAQQFVVGGFNMDGYGAYLIRGSLWHRPAGGNPNGADDVWLRTIDQVFVQVLPPI